MEVILLMAQTLDGKIARMNNQFVDWSGIFDKAFFTYETKKAGAVIMGSRTFSTIGKPLKDRMNIIITRDDSKNYRGDNRGDGFEFMRFEPTEIFRCLSFCNYRRAFLIGGSEINTLFAKKRLIDKVYISIIPKIFGNGLSTFNEDLDIDLIFQSNTIFPDGTALLKYDVNKKRRIDA